MNYLWFDFYSRSFCANFSNFFGELFSPSLSNALSLTKKYQAAFSFFTFLSVAKLSRKSTADRLFDRSKLSLRAPYRSGFVPARFFRTRNSARRNIINDNDLFYVRPSTAAPGGFGARPAALLQFH